MRFARLVLLGFEVLLLVAVALHLKTVTETNAQLQAELRIGRFSRSDAWMEWRERAAAIRPGAVVSGTPGDAPADPEAHELAQLRTQARRLRLQLAWARRAAQEQTENREYAESVQVPANMLTAGTVRDVGLATPADARQSGFWSATQGDPALIMGRLGFDEEGRAALDRLFAGLDETERRALGTADRLAGKVFAAQGATLSPPVASGPMSFPRERIVAETVLGPDEVQLTIEIQGNHEAPQVRPPVRMRRFADGWKELLTVDDVTSIAQALEAMTPSQRANFILK